MVWWMKSAIWRMNSSSGSTPTMDGESIGRPLCGDWELCPLDVEWFSGGREEECAREEDGRGEEWRARFGGREECGSCSNSSSE